MASRAFYDAVLAKIGWSSHADFAGWRGCSKDGSGEGFVSWAAMPFDCHATAMAQGGRDEGAPGPRPDYGPNWYAPISATRQATSRRSSTITDTGVDQTSIPA